jgi:hypothetical protein
MPPKPTTARNTPRRFAGKPFKAGNNQIEKRGAVEYGAALFCCHWTRRLRHALQSGRLRSHSGSALLFQAASECSFFSRLSALIAGGKHPSGAAPPGTPRRPRSQQALRALEQKALRVLQFSTFTKSRRRRCCHQRLLLLCLRARREQPYASHCFSTVYSLLSTPPHGSASMST